MGIKKPINNLRKCHACQLKEPLQLKLISKKLEILIDSTEHYYCGKPDEEMIKGTIRDK